ncbi:hypothetical protein N7448_011053 [Penicillium atrosanguineum]|nr:hypothetical protein N7448_011053 [Penicillium atrosanguineum]
MSRFFRFLLLAGALVSGITANQTLEREVVIVGAGAAGVSAALYLKQQGVSFAVVEKKPVFGGQTETCTMRYIDFRTATELSNFTYSSNLSAYIVQADKYAWLAYQTKTPVPIPSDLLLTFGDFVKKYSLQSGMFNIFFNVEGLGDLNVPHLIGLDTSSKGLAVTSTQNNQQAYLLAQAEFGSSALVNSTVESAQRDSSGVSLKVNTPGGLVTMNASKLLVAMPPLPSNMNSFDLDTTESELFENFTWSGYYAALVNATGISSMYGYQNAGIDTLYNLPPLPAIYDMTATGTGNIWLVRYGTAASSSGAKVGDDILSSMERLRKRLSNSTGFPDIEILAFANHLPYNVRVSAADIKNKFYNDLAALQGHRKTWYSGSAFLGPSSSDIWNATRGVVDAMLTA